MIDYDEVKKSIRFAIENYGTKTQGEEFRYDEVADYITELFIQLVAAHEAVTTAMEEYSSRITIKISAK